VDAAETTRRTCGAVSGTPRSGDVAASHLDGRIAEPGEHGQGGPRYRRRAEWDRNGRDLSGRSQPGGAMPTYVMLSTLTPEGVQTVKNNPQRIREVNKEVEQLGASVKAQWATLGQFDFISVVEAPDESTMARVSLELGSRGTSKYETLVAIPIDDFIASL
jgi:uncharacterized protein with GYD domain